MSGADALCTLLEIRQPVVLAPMAGIGGGRLACAVSRAGGLGLVGAGYGDAAWLDAQLALCRDDVFGVGFITWALRRQPHLLPRALDAGARVILLSFGSLQGLGSDVVRAGATLVAQVQTVAQARVAQDAGAQVIVAQGGEGGGHSGTRGTLALVPAVVDAVRVPVLAAGGIADHRGFAASLALGAAGVMCGTAFYVAEESLATEQAKSRLCQASGDQTVKGPLFDIARGWDWPDGPWGLRTLRNAFSEHWESRRDTWGAATAQIQQRYRAGVERHDLDIAAVIAGEAADLVHAVRPAGDIVRGIVGPRGERSAN